MKLSGRCIRRGSRRGAVLVEAALVLPLFFMFIMGIFDYGRYVMMLHLTTNAAREGARYALTHTQPVTIGSTTLGNATSDVTAIVSKAMGGQTLTGQNVQVYASDSLGNNTGAWTSTPAGGSICCKISGTFSFMIPTLLHLPSTVTISTQSVARCESN